MMLTALSLTPGVGELGPDEIVIGGRVFQFGIKHGHVVEHLTEMGLSEAKVGEAIVKDLMAKGAPPLGVQEDIPRAVIVEGKSIIYRPFQWKDGVINVGTYFPAP